MYDVTRSSNTKSIFFEENWQAADLWIRKASIQSGSQKKKQSAFCSYGGKWRHVVMQLYAHHNCDLLQLSKETCALRVKAKTPDKDLHAFDCKEDLPGGNQFHRRDVIQWITQDYYASSGAQWQILVHSNLSIHVSFLIEMMRLRLIS